MFEIFLAFLRLGCISFGGPAAHLGYFREEFVRKRNWLTESEFAQCIAIAQVLPGPASSQTGMLVGLIRAGWPGLFAAWSAFTLPSAVLMAAFASYEPHALAGAGWLRGLLVAAVAVVANAIVMMRRSLIPSAAHLALTFATAAALLALPYPATPPIAIALCALAALALPAPQATSAKALDLHIGKRTAVLTFCVFLALVFGLPYAAGVTHARELTLAARLFDTGSLVFGGGHVVLPLLQSQVVAAGIAPAQRLITGYAAAQAVPGPLFTLSSYIGTIAYGGALGAEGAIIATVAIFAPSFFLIAAAAPFYSHLARSGRFARALGGANASVLGLLAAAFVSPIWTNAVHSILDAVLAACAFAALTALRWPNWLVVAVCAAAGFVLLR